MTFDDYINQIQQLHREAGCLLQMADSASASELAEAESPAGGNLDQNLHRAWSIANGARSDSFFARPGYLTPYAFLSITAALDAKRLLVKIDEQYSKLGVTGTDDSRINPGWHQPGWMPFASFGGGTLLLISDTSPSASGHPGQVIGFVHDPDQIVYVAADFGLFLDKSLAAMRQDREEYFLDF